MIEKYLSPPPCLKLYLTTLSLCVATNNILGYKTPLFVSDFSQYVRMELTQCIRYAEIENKTFPLYFCYSYLVHPCVRLVVLIFSFLCSALYIIVLSFFFGVVQSVVLCVVCCIAFVVLFFSWPSCFLFFDIGFLITHRTSSNCFFIDVIYIIAYNHNITGGRSMGTSK